VLGKPKETYLKLRDFKSAIKKLDETVGTKLCSKIFSKENYKSDYFVLHFKVS
jgi:hypothetical protein